MKQVVTLLAVSYAGTALNVWWLSGFLPAFLLPDFSFLAIVYAGIFISGPAGFLAAVPPALFREVTSSMPPGAFFLSSFALFLAGREIRDRFFVRAESFVLVVVASLMTLESVSIMFLMLLSGSRPFSLLWGAQEAVRIGWTSLLAVPWFMDLSSRWRRVRE